MQKMERLLNILDVADLLKCSVKTVRRRVADGILPAIQEGGPGSQLRFCLQDIETALRVHCTTGPDDQSSQTKVQEKLSGPAPKWKK